MSFNRFCNIAVILAVLLTGYTMGPRAYTKLFYRAPHTYRVGDTVKLPGLVHEGRPTLLVAISPDCPTCRRNAHDGVYQRLGTAKRIVNREVDMSVVMPPVDEDKARTFVAQEHIPGKWSTVSSMVSFPFTAVPNVMLVGANGKVMSIWRGGMNPTEEAKILSLLN